MDAERGMMNVFNIKQQNDIFYLWAMGSIFSGECQKTAENPLYSGGISGWNSEGAYLKTAAEEFSNKIEDPSYGEAVQLFIQEENVHSDYLARYMRWHGISKKRRSSLNRIFQILRRTMGIRSEVTVLVTAEIIALSYYSALGGYSLSKFLSESLGYLRQSIQLADR